MDWWDKKLPRMEIVTRKVGLPRQLHTWHNLMRLFTLCTCRKGLHNILEAKLMMIVVRHDHIDSGLSLLRKRGCTAMGRWHVVVNTLKEWEVLALAHSLHFVFLVYLCSCISYCLMKKNTNNLTRRRFYYKKKNIHKQSQMEEKSPNANALDFSIDTSLGLVLVWSNFKVFILCLA